MFQIDQRPSTSQNCKQRPRCKKNISKQSPWKNVGGKVNRFKKIRDYQTRKLIKRSVYKRNNQSPKEVSPRKSTKSIKRLINNSHSYQKAKRKRKSRNSYSVSTLDEVEICSDDDRLLANTSTVKCKLNDEDDKDKDDCIFIESTDIDEDTIDDDNDDGDDIDNTLSNKSLIHSFKEHVSSTPCHNNSTICHNSNSSFVSAENLSTGGDTQDSKKTLNFFVDTGRSGFLSLSSTDTLCDDKKFSTLGLMEESRFDCQTACLKENNSKEVIDLDDSHCKEGNSSLKRRSSEEDDSVIFVCESNVNDFIPINNNTTPPHKILKIDKTTKNLDRYCMKNYLFTRSEKKKLSEYNKNAYNPSGDKILQSGKRMVIIDGSNVAFKHGLDQGFSVKGLKIAIDYFEKMGHEVKAVIPQFRMNKGKSSDPEGLERLHKAGKIVQTPCKNFPGFTSSSYDDRFILQLAFELDAAIVSNDNYRDLLHENPAFKKIIENRVIGYTWCNDIFILPKDPYGRLGPTLNKILNRC